MPETMSGVFQMVDARDFAKEIAELVRPKWQTVKEDSRLDFLQIEYPALWILWALFLSRDTCNLIIYKSMVYDLCTPGS